MRLLRVVYRMTMINVMMTLEYRGAFFIYMVNTVAVPLISLLVWLTVTGQGVRVTYGRSQLVTYFVVLSLVSMLTSVWFAFFLARDIRTGRLSPWLLRPVSVMAGQIANNLGEKIVKLPLLLPLVVMLGLAFHADIRLPAAAGTWALFLLALPPAAAIAFLLDYLVGLLAFWVQDVGGLIRFKGLLAAFLSGQVVPLALFPPVWSGLLQAQPFRYTISFPLEILVGGLHRDAIVRGFGWQIGYCLVLWACSRVVWRWGLRSYSAVGA